MQPVLREMPLAGGSVLRVHLVEFAARGFDAAAFDAAGIARPADISRSVRKRQAEFFFGRLAARAALRDAGADDAEVPIGPAREPIWPAEVTGSISHVDGIAAAAARRRGACLGLGIDIERTALGEAQAAMRKLAIDAAELARLRALDGALSLEERVTLVFSAKESLYKALFASVGHYFGFEAARVSTIDERRSLVRLVLSCDLHRGFAHGQGCDVSFDRLDEQTFLTAFEARRPAFDTRSSGPGSETQVRETSPPR